MIGIIGAMDSEVNGLKSMVENKKIIVKGNVEYVTGKIRGKEVVIAKCGVGKVFAAMCAQSMINEFSPSVIVNTGVAGSMSEKLGICSVAVGTDTVQYDMDTSALGDAVGLISGINIIHIPCTKRVADTLTECVKKTGSETLQGTIASADKFLFDKQEKESIKKHFGAIACDMESGSIGQVCFVNSVDFGIIRAISDSANDDSHMDYSKFMPIAAEKSISIVLEFIERYNI